MRLFVAIKLSDDVVSHLKELQEEILDDNVKCSKTRGFHLTLKFLGEVDDSKVDDIKEALGSVDEKGFELKLGKLGFFPDEKYIRVLWAGVEEDKEVNELQKKVADVLEEFGGDKRFSAHLTLARVKFIKDKEAFLEKVKSKKADGLSWKVDRFFLIKSELRPEGPVYEDVGEFKLE